MAKPIVVKKKRAVRYRFTEIAYIIGEMDEGIVDRIFSKVQRPAYVVETECDRELRATALHAPSVARCPVIANSFAFVAENQRARSSSAYRVRSSPTNVDVAAQHNERSRNVSRCQVGARVQATA